MEKKSIKDSKDHRKIEIIGIDQTLASQEISFDESVGYEKIHILYNFIVIRLWVI